MEKRERERESGREEDKERSRARMECPAESGPLKAPFFLPSSFFLPFHAINRSAKKVAVCSIRASAPYSGVEPRGDFGLFCFILCKIH